MKTIDVLNFKLLDAPCARDVIQEVINEDCYRVANIPDGSIVIDGGAFYGEFGIACAMTKNCKVICVEPSPANFEILKANAPKNVVVLNEALARNERNEEFIDRPDHPAGSIFKSFLPDMAASTMVRCSTIPALIAHAKYLFGHLPICLKLDIEGAEREIFDANIDWLKDVHYVGMEWHSFDGDFYADILVDAGFKIIALEGAGPPPRPAWDKSIGGGLLVATR